MREIKPVPFAEGYFASKAGDVFSCWTKGGKKTNRLRKIVPDQCCAGTVRVTLRVGPRKYRRFILSHVILEAFGFPRLPGLVACHWNGNALDNRLANLRWDTRSANEQDKRRHGTYQEGENNPAAKLTKHDVHAIRQLHAEGHSQRSLARRFDIDRKNISQIIHGTLWRCV